MAIVVETGAIVAGANSYVTEAELTTWATARGITIADADREKWLILAMDYLETLSYKGYIVEEGQPLQFPRRYLKIDGYYIEQDEIPEELKNVQLHLASQISQGVNPISDVGRNVKRRKVGDLEIEYMDGAGNTTVDRKLSMLIRKLIKYPVAGGSFVVGKA